MSLPVPLEELQAQIESAARALAIEGSVRIEPLVSAIAPVALFVLHPEEGADVGRLVGRGGRMLRTLRRLACTRGARAGWLVDLIVAGSGASRLSKRQGGETSGKTVQAL